MEDGYHLWIFMETTSSRLIFLFVFKLCVFVDKQWVRDKGGEIIYICIIKKTSSDEKCCVSV